MRKLFRDSSYVAYKQRKPHRGTKVHQLVSVKSILECSAVLLVLVCFQVGCHQFRKHKSVTVDETCYLACAARTWRTGRLDPMLARSGIAPLPILLQYLPVVGGATGGGRAAHFQGLSSDHRSVTRARSVTSWIVGSALIIMPYVWMLRRRGFVSAIFVAVLLAASPSILAHSSLATTDALAALTWLLATMGLCWFAQSPSIASGLVVTTTIGAALAAKYSAVALVPVLLVTCLAIAGSNKRVFAASFRQSRDFIAISASSLYGLSPTSTVIGSGYRFLLERTPYSRAGHSILIYDLRQQRGTIPDQLQPGNEERE